MALRKISELTSAGALDRTESVEIVQAGNSRRTTVGDILESHYQTVSVNSSSMFFSPPNTFGNDWLYTSFPAGSGHGNAIFGPGTYTQFDADFVRNTVVGSLALTQPDFAERTEAIGQGAMRWARFSSRNTAIGTLSMQWLGQDPANLAGMFHDFWWPVLPTDGAWDVFGIETRNAGVKDSIAAVTAATGITDVERNVGVGRDSLVELIKGVHNTAIGYRAIGLAYECDANTGCGYETLRDNVFGNSNTALGRHAGVWHQEGDNNVYLGERAGAEHVIGERCVMIGHGAGATDTDGDDDKFVLQNDETEEPLMRADFPGTGDSNKLNIRAYTEISGQADSAGGGEEILRCSSRISGAISTVIYSRGAGAFDPNVANACAKVGTMVTTGRSINAGGTINAAGADYAEYFQVKPGLIATKGDILGLAADGLLTDVFDDVIGPFLIKSTSPNLVGNDRWGSADNIASAYGVAVPGDKPREPRQPRTGKAGRLLKHQEKHAAWESEHAAWSQAKDAFDVAIEQERVKWDRMALCGQVPANVKASSDDIGKYLVPINYKSRISAVAISGDDLSRKEERQALGVIVGVDPDGRARVLVR